MKYIEIDEELYRHIASKTERIGESASEILRRLLDLPVEPVVDVQPESVSQPSLDALDSNARDALFDKAKTIVEQLVNHRAQIHTEPTTIADVTPSQVSSTNTVTEIVEQTTDIELDKKHQNVDTAEPNVEIDFDSIVNEHLLEQQKGAVGRFMFLLNALAIRSNSQFENVLNIQGKGRLYFARSKQALLDSSQSSNPKQIGDSNYWVSTNNNTAKKRTILKEVLLQLGCEECKALTLSEHI
ncbi:replication initiation negative regulator SeqA [Shewanella gaetbuli]|uniref:Replication initiation negative regulator SeqA n=1 Tax=Shewanella gaetbuli TaxID=220752 RepID=A0A9X2CGN4_9GAMM|nr:replication initiation negative regulator SeqA [Shewanella gaetbuli]MCL1142578.1 replication initiation negative regulator SeqA [Shewanella gaetbuli]